MRLLALTLVLMTACATTDSGPMATPAEHISDDSADRYFRNLVSAIESRGVRVDESALAMLRQVTQYGAAQLRDATSGQRAMAEANLRDLAAQIAEDAAFDESSRARTASASTVQRTLRRWCPRYPWC